MVNIIISPQPKPLWQYQWSNMNMTELPVAFLCWFLKNKDDIAIIAQHMRDFVYNRGRAAVTQEGLKRLGCLEPWIFEYEFRYIFPKMYVIPDRHLRNDA